MLAPVAVGAWLNMSFPAVMKRLSPFAPLLAASMTILISASIVAQNAVAIKSAGLRLVLAVVCLHLGELLSYSSSRSKLSANDHPPLGKRHGTECVGH